MNKWFYDFYQNDSHFPTHDQIQSTQSQGSTAGFVKYTYKYLLIWWKPDSQ